MVRDTIGVILPWLGMYIHTEMLQGIRSVATSYHYRTLAFYGYANVLHHYIDKERIAGWIILNTTRKNEWLDDLDPAIPQIIISPESHDQKRSIVIPDNEQGAFLATNHLIQHGHSRIAFVGSLRHADIAGRYRGYQRALEGAGLAIDPELVLDITWSEFWRRDAADEIITDILHKNIPFTAVFAASDELAIGVLNAFKRVNMHVPNTIALVGFDDSPLASTTSPLLTTVRQSFVALGEMAARRLISLLQDKSTELYTYEVGGVLAVRESCGCAPQYIRDNLLTTIESQSSDEKIQIMAIVHCLVSVEHKSTAEMYTAISRLYTGFHRALYSSDLKDWSATLEQSLPSVLRHADMVSNIPFALNMLSHSIIFPEPGTKPKPELIERAKELVEVAENAVLFFSRLGTQTQESNWFEIINAIRSVSSTIANLDFEGLMSLQWLYMCDIHYAALYLVDHDTKCLRVCGFFHEGRAAVKNMSKQTVESLPLPGSLPREIETPSMFYALSFAHTAQGWLYVVPKAKSLPISQTYYGIWVEQLMGLLDGIRLSQRLDVTLQELQEQQQSLSKTIEELAAPIAQIAKGIGLLPLHGHIHQERFAHISRALLERVRSASNRVIVVDMSNLHSFDPDTMPALLDLSSELGQHAAQIVLCGPNQTIQEQLSAAQAAEYEIRVTTNVEKGLEIARELVGSEE